MDADIKTESKATIPLSPVSGDSEPEFVVFTTIAKGENSSALNGLGQ